MSTLRSKTPKRTSKKSALLLALLASSSMTTTSKSQVVTEPPHGSVLFPAGVSTYYYNPGFPDTDLLPSNGSGEGYFSFWWNSGTAPSRNSLIWVIQTAYNANLSNPLFDVTFYNTFGIVGSSNGTHLRVRLSNGTNNCIKVSTDTLNFNSTWGQPIQIQWNTNVAPNEIFAAIAQTRVAWNDALQIGCNTTINTLWSDPGVEWTIGAGGNGPGGFYHGMFAQFFGHFQNGDWNKLSILGQRNNPPGYPMLTTVKRKSLTDPTIVPLNLGVDCQDVFGPYVTGGNLLPAICMRGDSMDFPINHGGDTTFEVPPGFVPPSDGASDPFVLR